MRTTAELAAELRCSKTHVLNQAKHLGIGANLGGRAGYRFTDDDVAALLEALRPKPVQQRRRRTA